eukprot:6616795-Prymnesium_polylepis.2
MILRADCPPRRESRRIWGGRWVRSKADAEIGRSRGARAPAVWCTKLDVRPAPKRCALPFSERDEWWITAGRAQWTPPCACRTICG